MTNSILRFVEFTEHGRFYHQMDSQCTAKKRAYKGSVRRALEAHKRPCLRCFHHPANCLSKGMFGLDCRRCDGDKRLLGATGGT